MHELVRVLAERGLVERVRRDGRSLQLDVTPAGHRLLNSADPAVDRVEHDLLGPSPARAQLEAALTELTTRLAGTGSATAS